MRARPVAEAASQPKDWGRIFENRCFLSKLSVSLLMISLHDNLNRNNQHRPNHWRVPEFGLKVAV